MTDLIPQLESSLSFARELNALKEQNRVLREALAVFVYSPRAGSGFLIVDDDDMANARAALTNKVPA
jgi:hypothetical protein